MAFVSVDGGRFLKRAERSEVFEVFAALFQNFDHVQQIFARRFFKISIMS